MADATTGAQTETAPAVRVDIEGPVATLTLNRPKALNALNGAMTEALFRGLSQVDTDPAVRVVVIRGANHAFMAGGDVTLFAEALGAGQDEGTRAMFESLIADVHQSISLMRRMPKPLLAAVEGPCAGFGVSLMLACDLAVAADSAFFTLAYCHIGTNPDGGSTYHLPRVVGSRRAMEIALFGDRFDARQAERWNLVNRVFPDSQFEEGLAKLVAHLAHGPTAAYAKTKDLISGSFDRGLDRQLTAEQERFAASALTGDFAEGVKAFMDKRRPDFTGR